MKPTTLAFIKWLKLQAETYLRFLDRDTVAILLWQGRYGFHWAWRVGLGHASMEHWSYHSLRRRRMKIREIGKVERDIAQHLQKFSYQQRSLPYCLDYAQLLIARIGKAFRDGELEQPNDQEG